MSAYGIAINETECMLFMIKEQKVFEKYMEIREKVCNIIQKRLIMNLYLVKKYVIA